MALTITIAVFYFIEIIVYSFHLSVLIFMFLQQKTNFNGAFFNNFRAVLIADLVSYIISIFVQKLPLVPFLTDFFKENVYFVTFASDIGVCTFGIQFIGHLFLALNRFTIVWFPIKHKNIWNRQWYTVLLIIFPFVVNGYRLHQPLKYVFTEDGSFYVTFANSYVTPIHYTISTTFYFTTTCLTGILNVLAFLKFVTRKQSSAILNVNERNLLFVSLILFVAQLFRITYNVGYLFFGTNTNVLTFLTSLLPYLIDVYAWSGSVSLLFLSSSTRQAYMSFYFNKSNIKIITPSNTFVASKFKMPAVE